MFRFTIRDVLWLTVVVALAVGWLVDHRRQQSARLYEWHIEALTDLLKHQSGVVATTSADGVTVTLPNGTVAFYPTPEWENSLPNGK
jgi:hypothetical protein